VDSKSSLQSQPCLMLIRRQGWESGHAHHLANNKGQERISLHETIQHNGVMMLKWSSTDLGGVVAASGHHLTKELLASLLKAEQQLPVSLRPGCQLQQQLDTPSPLQHTSHTAADPGATVQSSTAAEAYWVGTYWVGTYWLSAYGTFLQQGQVGSLQDSCSI